MQLTSRSRSFLASLLVAACASSAWADTIAVSAGESIQAAIDSATAGDVVQLAAGEYVGDIDFAGKAITVVGAGRFTVIRGTGETSVVTFDDGEGADSVLDSVLVTGGLAQRGGGVHIIGSSPTIVRSFIVENRATSRGSGIAVDGLGAAPRIFNNVVSYNGRMGFGDPHAIQVFGNASAAIVNNTIVRNDSNGVHITPGSSVNVVNNIFANNGAVVSGVRRGRGICDFSSQAVIVGNNFHRNRIGALLRGGTDFRRITQFEKQNPALASVGDNVDGRPGFLRNPPPQFESVSVIDLTVSTARNGRALNAGAIDEGCRDLDGGRNSAGHTGGPFALGSRTIPGADACGVVVPTLSE